MNILYRAGSTILKIDQIRKQLSSSFPHIVVPNESICENMLRQMVEQKMIHQNNELYSLNAFNGTETSSMPKISDPSMRSIEKISSDNDSGFSPEKVVSSPIRILKFFRVNSFRRNKKPKKEESKEAQHSEVDKTPKEQLNEEAAFTKGFIDRNKRQKIRSQQASSFRPRKKRGRRSGSDTESMISNASSAYNRRRMRVSRDTRKILKSFKHYNIDGNLLPEAIKEEEIFSTPCVSDLKIIFFIFLIF